jgi:hypothetical protein
LAGKVWNGFTYLRIGTGVRLLWTRWWTFRFWHHGVSSCTSVREHSLLERVLLEQQTVTWSIKNLPISVNVWLIWAINEIPRLDPALNIWVQCNSQVRNQSRILTS